MAAGGPRIRTKGRKRRKKRRKERRKRKKINFYIEGGFFLFFTKVLKDAVQTKKLLNERVMIVTIFELLTQIFLKTSNFF